jgi:uncharacterized protein YaaQ
MQNKQTLKVPYKFSQDIVSVNKSTCSYVDDSYFEKTVGENKQNKSYPNYPVEVEALKIGWILE